MISGEALKQEGMKRAKRGADPEWWVFMKAATIELARRKEFFFADDIEQIRRDRNGPSTHENRAMGPLMRELWKAGVCEPTNDWVASSQRQNHRGYKRVWHSLIFEGSRRFRRYRRRTVIDPRQFDLWQ